MTQYAVEQTSLACVAHPFGAVADTHMFAVHPTADAGRLDEFSVSAWDAVNEVLDDAILAGGMSGTKAWLVQHLLSALRASLDAASVSIGVPS